MMLFLPPLNILTCNSANKLLFFTSIEHWAKRLFVGFQKYGLLAELQARMSRDCRFSLFLHHNYQVTLNIPTRIKTTYYSYKTLMFYYGCILFVHM